MSFSEHLQFFLDRVVTSQGLVPSALEFAGDQAVIRIHGIVLPARTRSFEARLFECQFFLGKLLAIALDLTIDSLERCMPTPSGCNRRSSSSSITRSALNPPNEIHRSGIP
jgi:hypothetical protein